jgi:hypothetical protein
LAEGLLTEALPAFEQTAVALRLQRDAAYMQLTATAVRQVTVFPYTLEAARATATVEAVRFAQRTTVEAMQVAQQATATARAWQAAYQAKSTVQAHAQAITATVQAAHARQAELDLARAERLYLLQTYGPWALTITCALVLLWGLVRLIRVAEVRARMVTIPAHERELLLLDDRVVQPTRGHVPVINYREPEGAQPEKVTPEEQRTTTARAQTVDLMRAAHPPPVNVGRRSPDRGRGASVGRPRPTPEIGSPRSTTAGGKPKLTPRQAHELMMRQLAQQHPDTYAPIRVVPAAQVRKWLDDVRPQAYRDALTNDVET